MKCICDVLNKVFCLLRRLLCFGTRDVSLQFFYFVFKKKQPKNGAAKCQNPGMTSRG